MNKKIDSTKRISEDLIQHLQHHAHKPDPNQINLIPKIYKRKAVKYWVSFSPNFPSSANPSHQHPSSVLKSSKTVANAHITAKFISAATLTIYCSLSVSF